MAEPVSTTAIVFFARQVIQGLLEGPLSAEQNRLLLERSTAESLAFNAQRRETEGFGTFALGFTALAVEAEERRIADAIAAQFAQEIEQQANILAARPAAQLTREPVPVTLPLPVDRPAAQLTREPVPVKTGDDDMANGFELIPFINSVSNAASVFGGLLGGRAQAPSTALAGVGVAARGAAAGTGAMTTAFLGFGGGNGTPLQRARDATGKGVSRKQIILAARHCGLDIAASTFGISVEDVCQVVAKGMPRRSRGISSVDMRRTRSTLTKMNTMQKSLRSLCPPARRRSS